MRPTALGVSFILGMMLGTVLPAVGSAAAHWDLHSASGDDSVEIDSSRDYPFATQGPQTNSSFYFRAQNALGVWSAVSGSSFDFVYQAQRPMSPSLSSSSVTYDETWIMDYWTNSCPAPPGKCWNWPSSGFCPNGYNCMLGERLVSGGSGQATRNLIRINDDDHIPWYQGTGSPSPTQHDLYSVMVHEFGHATGAGHIDDVDCTGSNQLTMCGSLQVKGFTYGRSLETHERNDVADEY